MNRNPLKIVLTVLLVLIFIASFLFNILAFNSSYASLMFKHDGSLLETMHLATYSVIDYEDLEKGYSVKGKNIDGCDVFEAKYHINEKKEIETKTVCTIKGTEKDETTTYYFREGKIYIDKADKKIKADGSFDDFRINYPDVFDYYEEALGYDLNVDNYKTKMDFSFSPFYTLGIDYSFAAKDIAYILPFTVTYKYDLKGRLRKIIVDNDKNPSSLTIKHKDSKISYPDLTVFK